MNYYFINTDAGSLGNKSPHDLWFEHGRAFTGGDIKFGKKLARLEIGDVLVIYANRQGIVGAGRVQETWDGRKYKKGEQLVYVAPHEDIEYSIKVEWTTDFRLHPVDTYVKFGYTPRGTLINIQKHLQDVLEILDSEAAESRNELTSERGVKMPEETAVATGGTQALEPEEVDEIQFDDEGEDNGLELAEDATQRKVFSDKGDPEIDSLHRKFKRGRLDIQPEFQRQFVWDNTKSSRLIESILLDIPLPVIYLSEEPDGKTYVIDGQQRLTSLFSFIDGKHPDGKTFKLSKMTVFPDLNGKTFKDLGDDLQEKITDYKLRTVTFLKASDQNLKYEIFERLNSGSVSLNDQELRNCIYRGDYNDLMKELSKDADFRYLLGLQRPDKRMKDVELVLRFAAYYHATYLNYKSPMKNFLNKEAEKYRNASPDELNEVRKAFKNSCHIIKSLLADRAFKRYYKGTEVDPDGYWEKQKFNASLYDIMMGLFAKTDKNTVFQHLDAIREALIDLMTSDQEFIDSIELSTSSLQAVTKRFDKWRLALNAIIGIGKKETRCFTFQLKEQLFQANSTCTICGNQIALIDDAAVDHIKQYWTGGKTIPENARLTHRYCNWARPRSD